MAFNLFSVRLREKTDRLGRRYLFGAVPEISCVAFVFEEVDASGEKTFQFVVRPYGKAALSVDAGSDGQKILSLHVRALPTPPDAEEIEPPARAAR